MTDVKGKLAELIYNNSPRLVEEESEILAKRLIAHGVTVQEWFPVTERLPDTQEYDWVLAQITLLPECIYGVPVVAEMRNGIWYDAHDETIEGKHEKVTHWMPLPGFPKPPRGE